jgi:uncharacterized membrane protein YccC
MHRFDVEFFGGVIVGILIGLMLVSVAWAASAGPLWHWTVQKNGQVVCITPYVWPDLKLIECGES